ncbi:MAG: GNAT family N-acetyltransferase [Alphaproteobacteria bacterium]|nr:GNAT family N-acetyltransferase [Alphaproteobacteria bacterium]
MSLVTAIEAPPQKETLDTLRAGLTAYNDRFTGGWRAAEFVSTARDGHALVGGIYCIVYGETLFIEWTWLAEQFRGHGFGTKLLASAEAESIRRGAKMVHLDTFSFQARGFYERCGYRVFGTLDYPGTDVQRFYMSKLL